jgi:hypothetical protein
VTPRHRAARSALTVDDAHERKSSMRLPVTVRR